MANHTLSVKTTSQGCCEDKKENRKTFLSVLKEEKDKTRLEYALKIEFFRESTWEGSHAPSGRASTLHTECPGMNPQRLQLKDQVVCDVRLLLEPINGITREWRDCQSHTVLQTCYMPQNSRGHPERGLMHPCIVEMPFCKNYLQGISACHKLNTQYFFRRQKACQAKLKPQFLWLINISPISSTSRRYKAKRLFWSHTHIKSYCQASQTGAVLTEYAEIQKPEIKQNRKSCLPTLQYLAGLWLLKTQHMWKNNQSDGLGQERESKLWATQNALMKKVTHLSCKSKAC